MDTLYRIGATEKRYRTLVDSLNGLGAELVALKTELRERSGRPLACVYSKDITGTELVNELDRLKAELTSLKTR